MADIDPVIEFINLTEKTLNMNIRKYKPFPESDVMSLNGSEADALAATFACFQVQTSLMILNELHHIRQILEEK